MRPPEKTAAQPEGTGEGRGDGTALREQDSNARPAALKELAERSWRATRGLSWPQWRLLEGLLIGGPTIDPNAPNRRSAQASICRACAALEKRGLVVRSRGRATLTQAGEYAARNADQIREDRDFARKHFRFLRQVYGRGAFPVYSSAVVSESVNDEAVA